MYPLECFCQNVTKIHKSIIEKYIKFQKNEINIFNLIFTCTIQGGHVFLHIQLNIMTVIYEESL